ncbi:alpha/beta hydrolase fold domain-containing protein [Trichoderma longibrachiatum]
MDESPPTSAPALAPPSSPPPVSSLAVNFRLFLLVLAKLPLLTRVAILHALRLSEPAKYVDLQSNLVVSFIRALLTPSTPRSISYAQKLSTRNQEIKGRIWISLYASPPPPETDIRDALLQVIESMKDHSSSSSNTTGNNPRVPQLTHVEAEWTGYRAAASKRDPLPAMSEADKYRALMKECREPTTVLYFHGGAYYLCDPATHRHVVKRLAKLTGGRCYSVRYRLAPQHPFPSALLDALVSYFTLLYPPPDAYHEAVKPYHVVFAGDSAGGNLALALLQLIRQLRRRNTRIQWYGESRTVPLPAGVSCASPWLDITHSSPSWQGEDPHPFDYLPKPRPDVMAKIPPCDIWPAKPPRKHIYVDDDMVAHPLATLLMNRSWEGSPPIWMSTGWEILAYEDKALAMKLFADGVPLVFEEYEAMPHVFALLLSHAPGSRRCFESWASFISRAVQDPRSIETSATSIKAGTLEETSLKFDELLEDSLEDVQASVAMKAGLKTEWTARL